MSLEYLHDDLDLTLDGDSAVASQHGDRALSRKDWGIGVFDRVSDIMIDGALCDNV
jgi:hypothetical protein